MLRVLINIFLLLFGFIINSNLFECIKLQGVKPDLFIIFIVSISVLRSDVEGAIFGFFAGFGEFFFASCLDNFFDDFSRFDGCVVFDWSSVFFCHSSLSVVLANGVLPRII